jgi:hypothetical protein
MTLEHAASGRLAEFMGTNELNWDALYALEAPRIYNYFRFRLGSHSDVEELTARTFERAWRSRSRYRETSRVSPHGYFAKVKLLEKLVASLDVGAFYVPRPCEEEIAHPPGNAGAHP